MAHVIELAPDTHAIRRLQLHQEDDPDLMAGNIEKDQEQNEGEKRSAEDKNQAPMEKKARVLQRAPTL